MAMVLHKVRCLINKKKLNNIFLFLYDVSNSVLGLGLALLDFPFRKMMNNECFSFHVIYDFVLRENVFWCIN